MKSLRTESKSNQKMMPAFDHFEIDQLTVATEQKTLFGPITWEISGPGITCLVGPSGSGKSTFLYCLNRLIDFQTNLKVSGDVRLNGQSHFEHSKWSTSLRRQVGMVFQKPNPFPWSIIANLDLPLKEAGLTKANERMEKIENSLSRVGLWNEVKDRLKKPASHLSGGQQQRLCLARAISLDPSVLLMDEPTSSLDPLSCQTIESLIQDLRQEMTIVLVTHNLAQARRLADHIGVFWYQNERGHLIESGPAEQVLNRPTHENTKLYFHQW